MTETKNIIIIGEIGSGKSTLANVLSGTEVFKEKSSSSIEIWRKGKNLSWNLIKRIKTDSLENQLTETDQKEEIKEDIQQAAIEIPVDK